MYNTIRVKEKEVHRQRVRRRRGTVVEKLKETRVTLTIMRSDHCQFFD
jgi:hypothetical protein